MKERIWNFVWAVTKFWLSGMVCMALITVSGWYLYRERVGWEPWECSICRAAGMEGVVLVNRSAGSCQPLQRGQMILFTAYWQFPTPWEPNLHFCAEHRKTLRALGYSDTYLVDGETVYNLFEMADDTEHFLDGGRVRVSRNNEQYSVIVL